MNDGVVKLDNNDKTKNDKNKDHLNSRQYLILFFIFFLSLITTADRYYHKTE